MLLFVSLTLFLFLGCSQNGKETSDSDVILSGPKEPALEEKYVASATATFGSQTAIPEWKRYVVYALVLCTVNSEL